MTSALEKQSRLLAASNPKSFKTAIREGDSSKTDIDSGNAKAYGIDYSLYNYGGNAVLSLTKNNNPGFSWNETQASTVAALGNAALLLGGVLLYNSVNNRANSRAYNRFYELPPPRPYPLRKRRIRNGNKGLRKRRLRHRRPFIGGRRRLRKNMEVRRPGAAIFHRPQYNLNSYLNNHRIQDEYVPSQTRDQQEIPLLRAEDMLPKDPYTEAGSVLEPIKPIYDPYLYDDNMPMNMDEYYYDYYDDLPDVSALRGPATFNDLEVPDDNMPPLAPEKVFPITRQPLTSAPTLPNKDPFMESRKPSRQEVLLKMSEEKQREKLQKERAKLLEATFMNPTENKKPETEKKEERTRLRIPLKRRRKQNEQRNEVKEVKDDKFLTPFQTTFTKSPSISQNSQQPSFVPPFSQPPSYPPYSQPPTLKSNSFKEPSTDKESDEDFFFRGDIDPFEEMKSDFDVNNDDWISTISAAFEGFSDFKKLKK